MHAIPATQVDKMKNFLCAILFAILPFPTSAESNIRPANNERVGKIEIWGEYTRNSMFDDGDVFWVWKVAIIPPNTARRELEDFAKQLARVYPKKRVRIFDDKTYVKQFVERDIYLNDKSGLARKVEYPLEWVKLHHIANINDRSDIASNRWQLVEPIGKHIAFLQ